MAPPAVRTKARVALAGGRANVQLLAGYPMDLVKDIARFVIKVGESPVGQIRGEHAVTHIIRLATMAQRDGTAGPWAHWFRAENAIPEEPGLENIRQRYLRLLLAHATVYERVMKPHNSQHPGGLAARRALTALILAPVVTYLIQGHIHAQKTRHSTVLHVGETLDLITGAKDLAALQFGIIGQA